MTATLLGPRRFIVKVLRRVKELKIKFYYIETLCRQPSGRKMTCQAAGGPSGNT